MNQSECDINAYRNLFVQSGLSAKSQDSRHMCIELHLQTNKNPDFTVMFMFSVRKQNNRISRRGGSNIYKLNTPIFRVSLNKMSSPSRVCVVTGASYGLGSHIAKQLGEDFFQNVL